MLNRLNKLKYELIPLTFGVFIVISFMHNYDDSLTGVFLLISMVLQSLIYIFYDFISKKGKLMQYVSILGSFFAIGFIIIISINLTGNALDFFIWFISTQDVVKYSLSYVLILLVGLNFFIGSTVYYFTQVRYRMFVTFLLMLIPFSIFAKENFSMPIRYLLPLIVLYFTTLIVCGQNNLYDNDNLIVIKNKSYIKSVGSFILGFILIISLIPKPQIKADRDVFESLITANTLTDFLLSQLSSFTDTSNGTGFSFNSSKKLYTVDCTETIALKSRTFSNYDLNQNVWFRSDGSQSILDNASIDTNLYFNNHQYDISNYDRYGNPLVDNSIDEFKQKLNPTELLNAIMYAISKNEDFSKKYNLEDIPKDTTFQDCTKSLTVKSKAFVSSFVLNPTNTYRITNIINDNNELSSTYSGIILPIAENGLISNKAEYSMDYYSKSLMRQNYAHDILSKLSFDTYGDFLKDLCSITENSKFESVVDAYIQDYNNTITYSTLFTDCNNDKILNLAKSITDGYSSDIEKAEALENYFISNGFNYNSNFKRDNNGETIEDFLFNYKTGACYEYSTSMILMARAIGLPARYVEGFLVDNPTNTLSEIDITASSSHAYPEVYISGYGWCYFEPTQSYTLSEENQNNEFSQNTILIITSSTIFGLVVLTYLFMKLIYPKLYEKYFRKKVLRVSTNDGLSLIIVRIRKLCNLESSQTLEETRQSILELYKIDIQNIVEVANQTFYSNIDIAPNVVKKSLDKYIELYNTIIEVNKQNKRLKKKSKKN
ncbi:MAG: transglutaminase family protein [Oscillospiraceae bacterium]